MFRSKVHSDAKPPGPRGHWLWGNVAAFQADRLGFMRDAAEEHGGIVGLRFAHRNVLLVTDPPAIESVLVTNAKLFRKHFALRLNPIVLGNGLLTSEGDFWLWQRRLAQPAFGKSQIAQYAPTFVSHSARMLDQWQPGETRDILQEMMSLTLGIASKTLFGAEGEGYAERVRAALNVTQEEFVRRLVQPLQWPLWIPTASNRRLVKAVRDLDAIVYDFIRQRRSTSEQREDLLSRLLAARDEASATGMSDKQLRDECLTIFLAGQETTALAMAWSWYLLGQAPHAAERVYAEVDNVLNGRIPALDDLPNLKETEYVLLESMRLYPPAFIVGREALVDTEVGGYFCRRGTTVLMPEYIVHRDPRFFDRPDEFLPERWQNEFERRLPNCAYFPFGAGPRMCIGNTFAMMEMTLALAMMAQRFQFTLVPGQNITMGVQFTLRPNPAVMTTLAARKGRHE
jgi:cytochrome P450